MSTLLRRLEDLLMQVLRLVLLVFSLLLLFGVGVWAWQSLHPAQSASEEPTALNWQQAQPDLGFVVEETGRDLGHLESQTPMEEHLADPPLRPSFQRADGLIRGFVYMNPRQRKRIEEDASGQGLAPVHSLLKGEALPSAAEVQRQIRLREQRDNDQCCGASGGSDRAQDVAVSARSAQTGRPRADTQGRTQVAADEDSSDDSAASSDAEGDELTDPVHVETLIHERAVAAESEHGIGGYAAYVQGLPAALEKVLSSETVAPRLREQPASQLVAMLLVNYTLSFDRAAQKLKDGDTQDSSWDWANTHTLTLGLLMCFLMLVVMALALLRIERDVRLLGNRP